MTDRQLHYAAFCTLSASQLMEVNSLSLWTDYNILLQHKLS